MNKPKPEVPLWAKAGKKVWLEIRDSTDIEVEEYREAEVEACNYEKRELTVKDLKNDKVVEWRGDRLHEREDTHHIVNNLSDIPTLNDAELMKHLEVRYKNDLIHCFCGLTLIVINPYKLIEHEVSPNTMEKILKFLADKKMAEAFPHVWTISATAWHNLFTMNINQAVCISGESGAGKTESTKRCLEFITQMKGTGTSVVAQPIEKKIMSCNPILEAFGNAKTIRNDNSSRFGKYTTLFVDKIKRSVKGAAVENYLLEKSRVTNIGEKERNYHIFYCMCRFMPKDKQEKYQLINSPSGCDMKHFNYLNQSVIYEDPKVNDLEFWTDVSASLEVLRFTPGQQDAIWRSLAAVLYIGNFKIDESTFVEGSKPCRMVHDDAWKRVCSLLGINEENFDEALCSKELKVGGTTTKKPLSAAQVKNNIDTIAREIYNRMFNWIVKKLNKNLLPSNPKSPNFQTIGVLDIFGFEIFTKNSIEQLFINFANERLQGLYIDYIFKNEVRIFEEEGLSDFTQNIVYKDNKPLILALDNPKLPPGIFDLVDNTCALNKNDEYLHSDILKNHKSNPYLVFPRIAKGLIFMIKHTARDVEYATDGFVEKNKDELSPFLQTAFETSHPEVVSVFNCLLEGESKPEEDVKRNPKEKYLGFKFRRNMNELIETLASCYCHFIRCIKPNEQKKREFWDEKLALAQIRYMGLLDSLKIRKMSYPFRWGYDKFFQIFQDLDLSPNGAKRFTELVNVQSNFKDMDMDLLKYCGVPFTDKDVLYGKTRIFLNERFKIDLDKALYVKQKVKKQALEKIAECFKTYQAKREIANYFSNYGRSIMISRDLLKSWAAKIEGMEHKEFKRIVRRLQGNFRLMQGKRAMRLQKANMLLVVKRLVLQKLSRQMSYMYYYKTKVDMLQALIERKNKDAKNRICSDFTKEIFDSAWAQILKGLQEGAVRDVQRTVRGLLMRKQKQNIVTEFSSKIAESKEYNAAANIQRMVRGFLVRRKIMLLQKAARKIQGFLKTRWLRAYFKQVQSAAHVVGKFLRKMYIRKMKNKQNMADFYFMYSDYTDKIVRLENDILFADDNGLQENYKSSVFSDVKSESAPRILNYKSFIPPSKDIELNRNAKLMSVLIDLNVNIDTSSIYKNSWALEFSSFLKQTHEKGARMLHLEIGDSFSLGITDDKEIYTWGSNDFNQCARDASSDNFSVSAAPVRLLGDFSARIVSAGKEHSLLVDEFGKVQLWGKNDDGQWGTAKQREAKTVNELAGIRSPVVSAITKDNVNYALVAEGKVYQWPRTKQSDQEEKAESLNTFKPFELVFGQNVKIQNIDSGTDFAMFLSTNGQVYSMGDNWAGELGLGDRRPRKVPTLINWFTDRNEKIMSVSCGHKHTLAQTTVGKIFAWGLNHDYQLGQGDTANKLTPVRFQISEYESMRVKTRNVQAGFNSSFVLLSDRAVYYAGVTASNPGKPAKTPTRYFYEDKFFKSSYRDQFIPIRIFVKWSKVLSVVYLVYADLRTDSQNLVSQFNEKYVSKLLSEWLEVDKQLLPPQEEILNKSINLKYLQKPLKSTGDGLNKLNKTGNLGPSKPQIQEIGTNRFEDGNLLKGSLSPKDVKQQPASKKAPVTLKEPSVQTHSSTVNQPQIVKVHAQNLKNVPANAHVDKSLTHGVPLATNKAEKSQLQIKSEIKASKKEDESQAGKSNPSRPKTPVKYVQEDQLKKTDKIDQLVIKQAGNLVVRDADPKKNPLKVEPIGKTQDQEKDKILESMLNMMKKKDPLKDLDKSQVKLGKK